MIRSLILGVLAMVLLVSGPTPAYSCGAKVEIRFFDSDGDIFAIHNKSSPSTTKARGRLNWSRW